MDYRLSGKGITIESKVETPHQFGNFKKQINFLVIKDEVLITIIGRSNRTGITIPKSEFDKFIKIYRGE